MSELSAVTVTTVHTSLVPIIDGNVCNSSSILLRRTLVINSISQLSIHPTSYMDLLLDYWGVLTE